MAGSKSCSSVHRFTCLLIVSVAFNGFFSDSLVSTTHADGHALLRMHSSGLVVGEMPKLLVPTWTITSRLRGGGRKRGSSKRRVIESSSDSYVALHFFPRNLTNVSKEHCFCIAIAPVHIEFNVSLLC
jgi:hypothetical protein